MKHLVILVLFARIAAADPKTEAKQHVAKATAAHAAGKYADALAELEEAYKLDAQPGLLYAIAQVHVKLDECDKAIPLYEQFVASKPEAKAAAAASEAIETCKTTLAAKPKPEPPPEPKPEPPPVVVAPPPPPPPPTSHAWYADPLGGVLVGAGLVAGIVGIVEYRGATKDIDAAHSAENYGVSEDLANKASTKRTIAGIAGIGGIALVTAGVIRYVLHGSHDEVSVTATGSGAAVTWGGRF